MATAKIFIGSYNVYDPITGLNTTKDHTYLIYDPDGDLSTTTGQEIISRMFYEFL